MTAEEMERIRRAVEGEGEDEALDAAAARHGRRRRRLGVKRAAVGLAWTLLASYLLFLFAFLGDLFAKSHLMRVDVTGEIVEMFQVFLLPVLMLVLGFCFGALRR